jgi:hypothetical protein
MALTRTQKIQRAKLLLKTAQKAIAPYQKKLDAAEAELHRAEVSFDKGERVRVTQTCKRGCCVECEFNGVIVGPTPNGMWNVKADNSGHIHEYIYEGDMKRL